MTKLAELPSSLDWLRRTERGRRWRASVPALATECAEHWNLSLGEPFPCAYVSVPLAATLADGTPVVLKLQFPDRETKHEAEALRRWDGEGAIRLLDHDEARNALLLERCVPGTPLASAGEDAALDAFVALLPRLWRPAAEPFGTLADEAAWWAGGLPSAWQEAGRPFPRVLLDAALDALRTLPATQRGEVLLHQDLHAGNVLRAEREPWLVIDPKPLVGEREFGVAPIVRSFELARGRTHVLYRFDRLTAELGLDRERARLWALAQTVAWAIGSDHLARHVETATWLREAGR